MKQWIAALVTISMMLTLGLPVMAEGKEAVGDELAGALAVLEETAEELLGLENGIVNSGTCGENLTWTLDEAGTLTISGTGEMGNYSYDSRTETCTSPWYANRKSVFKVVINAGVTSIGDYAFRECSSLMSITIPDSVTSIGMQTFCGCSSLTSITLPAGVTSIGSLAFYDCSSLTSITIPDSVTSIGGSAFQYCTSLTSITLPAGVTSIGNDTFFGCTSLTSITLPAGVTSIGNYAFRECGSLMSITIPDSVTSIGKQAFCACSSLTSITIPAGVTSIGDSAFYDCYNLMNIAIPANVTSIGSMAFYGCGSLTSITIPDSVTSIRRSAFDGCNLTDVYYGGSKEEWNAIHIESKNDCLTSATIHYNSKGPEATTPDGTTGGQWNTSDFEFGRDDLSFTNREKYFFSAWENSIDVIDWFAQAITKSAVVKTYQISDEAYAKLLQGLNETQKEKMRSNRKKKWTGSCYGMAMVVGIHYASAERLPLSEIQSNANSVSDLKAPKNSESVEDLVNYYQLLQAFPYKTMLTYQMAEQVKSDYTKAVEGLIESVNNTQIPTQVGIQTEGATGGHAVLLLSVAEEKTDSYIVNVYDPNYTTMTQMCIYKEIGDITEGIHIEYGPKQTGDSYADTYNKIILCADTRTIDTVDVRNYFGQGVDLALTGTSVVRENNKKVILWTDTNTNVTFASDASNVTYTDGKVISKTNAIGPYYYAEETEDDEAGAAFDGCQFILDEDSSSRIDTLEFSSSSEVCYGGIDFDDWSFRVASEQDINVTVDNENQSITLTSETPGMLSAKVTRNDRETEECPWYTFAVDADNSTTLTLTPTATGVEVSSDNLQETTVAVRNDTEAKSVEVSSPKFNIEVVATANNMEVKEDGNSNSKQPEGGSGSQGNAKPGAGSGNSDGGAAILLAGVAAAGAGALAAWNYLPIHKVSGIVTGPTFAPLQNATITLKQGDTVVASATTDANGSYALRVRKGTYTLVVDYIDERTGKAMTQTAEIQAPSKNNTGNIRLQ